MGEGEGEAVNASAWPAVPPRALLRSRLPAAALGESGGPTHAPLRQAARVGGSGEPLRESISSPPQKSAANPHSCPATTHLLNDVLEVVQGPRRPQRHATGGARAGGAAGVREGVDPRCTQHGNPRVAPRLVCGANECHVAEEDAAGPNRRKSDRPPIPTSRTILHPRLAVRVQARRAQVDDCDYDFD